MDLFLIINSAYTTLVSKFLTGYIFFNYISPTGSTNSSIYTIKLLQFNDVYIYYNIYYKVTLRYKNRDPLSRNLGFKPTDQPIS